MIHTASLHRGLLLPSKRFLAFKRFSIHYLGKDTTFSGISFVYSKIIRLFAVENVESDDTDDDDTDDSGGIYFFRGREREKNSIIIKNIMINILIINMTLSNQR